MKRFLMILAVGFCVVSCSGLSAQQQRALSGGAGGAALGSIVGLAAGNTGLGAAIGGGVGFLGGLMWPEGEAQAQPQVQYEPPAYRPPVYRPPVYRYPSRSPSYRYPQQYPGYGYPPQRPAYRYPPRDPAYGYPQQGYPRYSQPEQPCFVCVPGQQ